MPHQISATGHRSAVPEVKLPRGARASTTGALDTINVRCTGAGWPGIGRRISREWPGKQAENPPPSVGSRWKERPTPNAISAHAPFIRL